MTGEALKLGNGHARNRYYNPLTENKYTHSKYYMQKENPVRAVSTATHTLEWKHLSTRTMELETSLSKPSWPQ